MKVQVRKCPYTGQLFEDAVAYSKHLKEVRERKHFDRWIRQGKNLADQAITQAQTSVANSDDFLEWFRTNWTLLVARGYYHNVSRWGRSARHADCPEVTLTDVRWATGSWGQHSNSHSCPQGGVTNWHGKPDLPRSYAGWHGRLEWSHSGQDHYSSASADMFRDTVIHTGTGGGSGRRYSYDVTLWADDWPAWKLWKILNSPHS